MYLSERYEYNSDASFFIDDYRFGFEQQSSLLKLNPSDEIGSGYVLEMNPLDGVYLSCANWVPKLDMERKYRISKEFLKLYFLESGNITLVQNGKKKITIQNGVNLYLNKPSSGRVIYGALMPIRYVSILLHSKYIDEITKAFPRDKFSLKDVGLWENADYNTPEISKIFMQIRSKMIDGLESQAYYESKIIEAMALISQKQRDKCEDAVKNIYLNVSTDELGVIKNMENRLKQMPLAPPSIEELCKISAMSRTKLRELFKKVYGVPLGRYIKSCQLEQAVVLLIGSNLSIGEIAGRLGYSNASKFSAAFKKRYKTTPSEYRLDCSR